MKIVLSVLLFLKTVTKSSRLIKQAEESLSERIERGNALMKKVKTYTEFGDVNILNAVSFLKIYGF